MSLREELLADFDSEEDDDESFDIVQQVTQDETSDASNNNDNNNSFPYLSLNKYHTSLDPPNNSSNVDPKDSITQASLDALKSRGDDITAQDLISRFDFKHISDVKSVSNLMTRLSPILRLLESTSPGDPTEYSLLVKANSYSIEIENEILIVHKFIKEHYHSRFSELESLVPSPVDYAKVVLAIRNDIENGEFSSGEHDFISNISSSLKRIVPPATYMVISMAAYESKGIPLSELVLLSVVSACELLLALDDSKNRIMKFVSNRIPRFAPNLTAVVGAHTAAQLLGASGGLKKLAFTANSNIQALGSKTQIAIGFGHTGIRQRGFLYYAPIVQGVPSEYRVNVMRIVSGKIVLASRIDFFSSQNPENDGSDFSVIDVEGEKMRKDIEERIEKLLEPPENRGPKALPIPIDKPSKKRAGKRIRKFKEQFKLTELQRAQNRMTFGAQETYDRDLAEFGGTLGSNSPGNMIASSRSKDRIRAIGSDKKVRAKMSKNMAARLQKVGKATNSIFGSDVFSNGTTTSLNIASSQGIQLVDPSKNNSQPGKESRWFTSDFSTERSLVQPSNLNTSSKPNNKRSLDISDSASKRFKR